MKYRILGKTGLKVSEIGMGTWQLADDPNCWVGADLKESLRSLHKFVELGGNFIDTAWVYGYSSQYPSRHPSDELIGKYLKESGKRNKIVIATKVVPKNWKWPAWNGIPISEVFPPKHIEKCVNDSLRSLGIETIDLMQFHVWQDYFADDDNWKNTVKKIIKSGKVRFWGLSINDFQPSNCVKTIKTGLISTVQCIFNIFHQKPKIRLFPIAKQFNIGIITRVPLDEGGLTGKFNSATRFSSGDFRQKYFTPARLVELKKRTDNLEKLLNGEAKNLTELALRFNLSFEEVTTVIPGMRKIGYVETNTAVSDSRILSRDLLSVLKNHAWERNFYPMPDPSLAVSNYIEQ